MEEVVLGGGVRRECYRRLRGRRPKRGGFTRLKAEMGLGCETPSRAVVSGCGGDGMRARPQPSQARLNKSSNELVS